MKRNVLIITVKATGCLSLSPCLKVTRQDEVSHSRLKNQGVDSSKVCVGCSGKRQTGQTVKTSKIILTASQDTYRNMCVNYQKRVSTVFIFTKLKSESLFNGFFGLWVLR